MPVLVFLACGGGREAISSHSIGTEAIVAPVSGSVDADGVELTQGDVRGWRKPTSGIPLSSLVRREPTSWSSSPTSRRALHIITLDDGGIEGPLSGALSSVLTDLERQLTRRAAS